LLIVIPYILVLLVVDYDSSSVHSDKLAKRDAHRNVRKVKCTV